MAGRWHVFHLTAGGGFQTGGSTSFGQLSLFGETGEVTLRPDGTVGTSDFRGLDAETLFPTGTWQYSASQSPPAGITWGVSDGIVFITPPGDEGGSFQLNAALGGDVLVGRPYSDGGQDGPSTELFLFVRASARQALRKPARAASGTLFR